MSYTLWGRIPVRIGDKPKHGKAHKVHKMETISWCKNCGADWLRTCMFKGSRGTGFCTYTENVAKRHKCPWEKNDG